MIQPVILPPIPSHAPSVSDEAAATALRFLEVFGDRIADDPLANDARAVLQRYFEERSAARVFISGADYVCTPGGCCIINR